jgi:hypothetical protein
MAYDKVVDSAALEAALKASADAIRGKTGGSGSIPWDAVKGFADAIAAIEAGGGGGGDILGHKFAAGSFTLAEDVTGATYTILTASELFEAIKDDFPGATSLLNDVYIKGSSSTPRLFDFLAVFCWQDNTGAFDHSFEPNELLAVYMPKASINSSSLAAVVTDNYGSLNVVKPTLSKLSLDFLYNGLCIVLSSSYKMFAGNKYNWIVLPLDHGEVR